jgi:hypothetical protein
MQVHHKLAELADLTYQKLDALYIISIKCIGKSVWNPRNRCENNTEMNVKEIGP